jgi:hypothetical protein
MKKSIYLLLVGSLVMLLPFGSSLNAMAIADYGNTDQYMKYAEGMLNKEYNKSHSDLIQKIKCNNINANLNNIDANIGSGLVEDINTNEANDGDLSAQGGEALSTNGDRNYVDKKNDFRVVCINNNNNTVVGAEPIPEPDLACEECFSANSTLQRILIDFLTSGEGLTATLFTEGSEGQLIAEAFAAGAQIDTIEKLCNELEKATEYLGVPLSDDIIRASLLAIVAFETGSTIGFESSIDELIECLLEKGIIVDREPFIFEPEPLTANGLSNPNVQITNLGQLEQ